VSRSRRQSNSDQTFVQICGQVCKNVSPGWSRPQERLASFRQDSTRHANWSRIGCTREVPVTGQRKCMKILGAMELWKARFHYRQDTVFNASTYFALLEQLARSYRRQGAVLIQDNATYHKKTATLGLGSMAIASGWKFINCLPTQRVESN